MSQNDVRTFRAETMQAALDLVRRELGPDAVILHTRELPQSRFFPWRRTTERVEITAGTGMNVRTPRAVLQQSGGRTAQPTPAPQRRPIEATRSYGATSPPTSTSPQDDQFLAPPPKFLLDRNRSNPTIQPPAPRNVVPAQPSTFRQPVPSQPHQIPPQSATAPLAANSRDARNVTWEQHEALTRQLSSIEKLVEKLTRETRARNDDVPRELFEIYTELIDAELDENLARELACQLKEVCPPERTTDASIVREHLRDLVRKDLRTTTPIQVVPGKRKVVALVGPTGVGKTTTIAKLAANFRLRDGIRMGLVTVDTYRVAAVEQLRTYAEIIDLPMKVVTTPQEMRGALDELLGLDLILIDTAGRSPKDEVKIQELKTLLAEAQVDEVHLVLSLTSSLRNLASTAAQFAGAGATSMILTKLDEASGMGTLLSVAKQVPLPISYLTTGQDVPDDIETADPVRMSRLILGEVSLNKVTQ